MSGTVLLTIMTIHLFQFRFGWTDGFAVGPTKFFINVAGNSCPHLFRPGQECGQFSVYWCSGYRIVLLTFVTIYLFQFRFGSPLLGTGHCMRGNSLFIGVRVIALCFSLS